MILRARIMARDGDLGAVATELALCLATTLSARVDGAPIIVRLTSAKLVPGSIISEDCLEDGELVEVILLADRDPFLFVQLDVEGVETFIPSMCFFYSCQSLWAVGGVWGEILRAMIRLGVSRCVSHSIFSDEDVRTLGVMRRN